MVVEDAGNKDLKFKNPERLLLVVVAFIFWSVGFIDLIGHTSADADIFGMYSLPFFIFIILYGCTIVIWIALFISPKLLSRVVDGIRYIQSKTWLAFTVLAGAGVTLWVILEWDRWSRLPGLQLSVFALVILAAAILIFSGWREHSRKQWWRKLIAYPLLALIAVEAVIQAVALVGMLPGTHRIGGNFAPYERVYHNQEGFRNDVANRYGWYFPDYSLNDNNKRILILGGSFVQALQVPPEQQLSTHLSTLIDQHRNETAIQTDVISIGVPGFGPSPYLYQELLAELDLGVDEIIVLFHLGDDFQSPSPAVNPIVYVIDEAGGIDVDPADERLRHDLTHYYFRGFLSFQLVETLRSHYLTPKVINGLAGNWINDAQATINAGLVEGEFNFPRSMGSVVDSFALTESSHAGIRSTALTTIPGGNNFVFKKSQSDGFHESVAIAGSILEDAHNFATANDIAFHVVTIPVFPRAFYNRFQADNWEPDLGDYDLFLPEKALLEIAGAKGISMLPMGQYMYQAKLDVDAIRQLYYSDGQGNFTPAGHAFFANAIYDCFYANADSDACFDNQGFLK